MRNAGSRIARIGATRLGRYSTSAFLFGVLLVSVSAWAQESSIRDNPAISTAGQQQKAQLNVNWLYGAYVPKEAPLVSLNLYQRERLFVRQTFTTPGIYVKSGFLALLSQARGEPYQWGGGLEGYGRRFGSNYARTAIQNVFSTAGNAALGFEPRYDRCHCDGVAARTKHAILRNFLTYNRSESELRPQLALYGAAMGAGMLSSVWEPRSRMWKEGYEGVLTQAAFGVLSNWVGEFAPEIRATWEQKKPRRKRN